MVLVVFGEGELMIKLLFVDGWVVASLFKSSSNLHVLVNVYYINVHRMCGKSLAFCASGCIGVCGWTCVVRS